MHEEKLLGGCILKDGKEISDQTKVLNMAFDAGYFSGVRRIDMTKCPYHDACVQYGCPELCRRFCDSDDITYDGMHPKFVWHRTKTLGRGGDCCDFCLKIK